MIQTEHIPSARNMVLRKQLSGCRPGGGCCSECASHARLGDDGDATLTMPTTSTDSLSLVPVMYNPATNVYGPVVPGESTLPLFSSEPSAGAMQLMYSTGIPSAPTDSSGSLFSTGTVLVMAGIGLILYLVDQQTGRKRR
jgi:hypothetical protein